MLNLILPNSYAKEINEARLWKVFKEAVSVLKLGDSASVTLRVTNNRVIRQFNCAWRGENTATDVLSFENAFEDPETGEHYLGDIMISYETARKQARAGDHSIQAEIEMLFAHGMLHLAGFDHANKEQWSQMTTLQDKILENLSNPLLGGIQYSE